MKTIISTIFFLFCLNSITAQISQEWVSTYIGTGSRINIPTKSAIDKNGNFIVAGMSDGVEDYDYIVLKYSSSGSLIWEQRYNGIGTSFDYLTGMVLDDSDNVYVTGSCYEGSVNGRTNWITIKYSSDGVMRWKNRLNWIANEADQPSGMAIDKEKNIYVTGYGKTSIDHRQMITIKYSPNGDSLWTKVYRSNLDMDDWGYSVTTDDSLNVYTSGYGTIPVGNEIVTIKYDSHGKEKWIQKYFTHGNYYFGPVFSGVGKDNNLVVVGYSFISNNYDFVTLKYSLNGDLLWSRLYDGGNTDRAGALYIDKHSNILIAGSAYLNNNQDYLILKYAPNGDTLLLKNINGEDPGSSDEAYSIASDSAENIYVTGYSETNSLSSDYLTIKLTPAGQIIWSAVYRTALNNWATCLSLDKTGSVYVAGRGELTSEFTGIVSVKYSQLTGMILGENNEIKGYELSNYPNPFNPKTIINYRLAVSTEAVLKVYDVLGNEITTLVNQKQNAGNYQVEFDGSDLSSGIYFYKLKVESTEGKKFVGTKRMVLLK